MEYDVVGNRVAVDGPLAGTVDRVVTRYDVLRRVIGTVGSDPDDSGPRLNIGVRTVYNARGLPETVEQGTLPGQTESAWSAFVPARSVVREFDAEGRVTKTSMAAGGSTYAVQQVSFDSLGRVECSVTRMSPAYFGSLPESACVLTDDDPFGPDRIIKYGYDDGDRVTSVISGYLQPDAITETRTYLPGGLLETQTDGNGNKTTYSYDGHGRLHRIYYPDPNTPGQSSSTDYQEFEYDLNSQVVRTRTRSDDDILTPRDALGRITIKDLPGTAEDVYFSYDNQGRLLSALYANVPGNGVTQTYDGLGRLQTRTVFGRQLSYQYDLAGRRTRLTHPDGFYVDYGYTNANELLWIMDSTGTMLATYGYNALGLRTSLSRPNGALTSYVPDAAQRLHQLTHDLSGTNFDLTASFDYNPAGQITSKTVSNANAYTWTPPSPNSTLTAEFNGQNQLTELAGASVAHDVNGNLQSGINNLSYTFDVLGQLRQASGGAGTVNVDYDPSGMLRRVTAGSAVTEYLYDGGDLVLQYDGSGNVLRRFVHGAGNDEPLVVYEGSGTSNRKWLHADERGSIITASNASGAASSSVKYSSFGESGALVSPFGYTGQLYLPELQLYYYKARMYSPKTGRFLQPDPTGYADGMNLYAYVGGDPMSLVDPLGLESDLYCSMGVCMPQVTVATTRDDCGWLCSLMAFDPSLWQYPVVASGSAHSAAPSTAGGEAVKSRKGSSRSQHSV
ncbi:MAG: RHS repeat-associated core domain-containing protein [Steroidobacteraceae bacterium]|nr:RHS repeat-associated core domain-containing protein [Steroidobacteraceae bacterium]